MKAMILAAGLGTRLRPLTDSIPKALVPVAGKPMIRHLLEKFMASGVEECVVNVHHFSTQLSTYIQTNNWGGMRVLISDESHHLMDTGGAILYAESLLMHPRAESFLVHNVDVVSNLSLEWIKTRARVGSLATLVVSERRTSGRYLLFDDELRLVGWTDTATGELRSPYLAFTPQMLPTNSVLGDTLDVRRCHKLAFGGVHWLSPAVFPAFRALGYGNKEQETGINSGFSIIDFYVNACAMYPIYGVVPPDFRFLDLGKVETLSAAEAFIRELQ